MLIVRARQLMLEKALKEGRPISVTEVATATGIGRATLSQVINQPGYNTTTDVIDALLAYFACPVEALLAWEPKSKASQSAKKTVPAAAKKKPAAARKLGQ